MWPNISHLVICPYLAWCNEQHDQVEHPWKRALEMQLISAYFQRTHNVDPQRFFVVVEIFLLYVLLLLLLLKWNFLFSLFLHIIWQIQEHDKFLVSWAAQNYFSIHILLQEKELSLRKDTWKGNAPAGWQKVHLKMHFAPLPSELPFYTILPFEIPSNCLVIWIQFGNKLFRFGAANIALFN